MSIYFQIVQIRFCLHDVALLNEDDASSETKKSSDFPFWIFQGSVQLRVRPEGD